MTALCAGLQEEDVAALAALHARPSAAGGNQRPSSWRGRPSFAEAPRGFFAGPDRSPFATAPSVTDSAVTGPGQGEVEAFDALVRSGQTEALEWRKRHDAGMGLVEYLQGLPRIIAAAASAAGDPRRDGNFNRAGSHGVSSANGPPVGSPVPGDDDPLNGVPLPPPGFATPGKDWRPPVTAVPVGTAVGSDEPHVEDLRLLFSSDRSVALGAVMSLMETIGLTEASILEALAARRETTLSPQPPPVGQRAAAAPLGPL